MTKRVCIIGAGPCGVSALFHFDKLGSEAPEIVCYEKGSTWLGLWNYTWMTGTDEFGEPCHYGMYKHLWSNGPKECLEYPDYTFDEHYGKAIPSFPPRLVLREYMEGRFVKKSKTDLKRYIKWNTVVRNVKYHKETDDFTVTVEDLKTQITSDAKFSHVIVSVGIFNVPNKPTFVGMETFPGTIIHAHDFREALQYKNRRVLVVGASYSAEDIALQCIKFGAKRVVTSYRTKPMGFKWPNGIEERPLIKEVSGNTIKFIDGSSVDVDAIILCTGYRYHFPFLDEDLRLRSALSMYPKGLYRGSLWLNGGNNKVFYMGVQDQYFTFTMFDAQGQWISRYIMGTAPNVPLSNTEMRADADIWSQRAKDLKNCHDDIDFQTDFLKSLITGTKYDVRSLNAGRLFHTWEHAKVDNIVTYRDLPFKSVFTGTVAASHKPWIEDFDDTVNSFVN